MSDINDKFQNEVEQFGTDIPMEDGTAGKLLQDEFNGITNKRLARYCITYKALAHKNNWDWLYQFMDTIEFYQAKMAGRARQEFIEGLRAEFNNEKEKKGFFKIG